MGTLSDPVPVTGLVENFSPMPRIAPPPLGSESVGTRLFASAPSVAGRPPSGAPNVGCPIREAAPVFSGDGRWPWRDPPIRSGSFGTARSPYASRIPRTGSRALRSPCELQSNNGSAPAHQKMVQLLDSGAEL